MILGVLNINGGTEMSQVSLKAVKKCYILYLLTVSEMLLWRLTWRWNVFCRLGVWGEGERRCGSSICWLYQLGVASGFSVTRAVQEEDPADAELRLSEGSQEPAADRRQESQTDHGLERVSWGLHTGTRLALHLWCVKLTQSLNSSLFSLFVVGRPEEHRMHYS